jgi:hypothetical protein
MLSPLGHVAPRGRTPEIHASASRRNGSPLHWRNPRRRLALHPTGPPVAAVGEGEGCGGGGGRAPVLPGWGDTITMYDFFEC